MAYTIFKSDGTELVVLDDYLIDSSTLSLNLIGKNVSGYGSPQNENFLYLLENFASSIPPNSPLTGQLWYDKNAGVMRPMVYDGGTWRPLSVLLYSNTTTDRTISNGSIISSQVQGDFWFKADDQQLYINTGTAYSLIGPELVPGFGTTKMSSDSMKDLDGVAHPIIKMVLDNEVVGIISNTTFNSTSTFNPLVTHFPTVYRGMTFANYNPTKRYPNANTDVVFHGLHEQLDITYPRRDIDEHIQGNWIFEDNVMLQLGTQGNTKLQFISGSNNLLVSNPTGVVTIEASGSGVTFNDSSLSPQVLDSFDLGLSNQRFRTLYTKNVSSGGPLVGANLIGTWALGASSKLVPSADAGNDIGSPSLRFNNLYAFSLNSGADQGTIKGSWQLDANVPFIPVTDGINAIGSSSKKFAQVWTTGISTGDPFNTLDVVGQLTIDGSIYPTQDQQYNVGNNAARYNTVYTANLDSNVVRTGDLSATINTLLDSFANSITRFDRDTQLTADSDSRLPTQHAVKAYVDQLGASLIDAIAALQASVANLQFVPSGTVFHLTGSQVPTGYLFANGDLVNVADYPTLFRVIGYTYGGNGTQFALPDLRGQFIRGWDQNKGVDPARIFGSVQPADVGSHTHDVDELFGQIDDRGGAATDRNGNSFQAYNQWGNDNDGDTGAPVFFPNRTAAAGGAETRPTNVALLPIIKI